MKPVGLGARDSLRLEAGLCLYGSDITERTTPVEAALSWAIAERRRKEGGYPGDAVLKRQWAEGVARKRVGILPEGKAPARAHTEIADDEGREIGEVTSGGFGPSAGHPVADQPNSAITLTTTERRIAAMADSGADVREIAQALFLTPHTVEITLESVRDRLASSLNSSA